MDGAEANQPPSPAKGDVEVATGSGSVELSFPPGTGATASLASGSGSVRSELARRKGAKLKVKVRTGSGDIFVR